MLSPNFWGWGAPTKMKKVLGGAKKIWDRDSCLSNFPCTCMHTSSPNFFRGVLGRKWKSPRKKKGSQMFRLRRAFFVVEALKTVKKPLKTVNFSKFFPKTVKFLKKGTPKNFRLRRPFFQKSPRSILRKSSVKVGGVKNILQPPPLWRGMYG